MNRQEDIMDMQDQLLKYRHLQPSDRTSTMDFLYMYSKLAKDFQAEREAQALAKSKRR
jgi:hypothetical protein